MLVMDISPPFEYSNSMKIRTKSTMPIGKGSWFALVVNSLILKVKDISIFAAKISSFFSKLDISAKVVLCM